ncbi:guanine nucleotide-binding protein G(I)/G(S)/G(O) subunit gamma-11 isoform 1-T7 [Sarcophilus harrisii]|uniref:G protein gamma domain-containing protein n=1 Tax=Sarcophilus harrisii TaxID=9305 RepID=A0A7N4V0H9_SARHA
MPAVHVEDLSEKDKLKMEVAQLRKEAKLQRQQVGLPSPLTWAAFPPGSLSGPPGLRAEVSKCSEEIKKYIEARCGEDPLVKGIPEDKNPYKEKAGCTVS